MSVDSQCLNRSTRYWGVGEWGWRHWGEMGMGYGWWEDGGGQDQGGLRVG